MITYKSLLSEGIVTEIADKYQEGVSAGGLLQKIGIKPMKFKPFGDPTIEKWWIEVLQKIESECGNDRLLMLLNSVADEYPGSERFKPFLLETSKPENRGNRGGNININLSGECTLDDIVRIMSIAKETVLATGGDVTLNYTRKGSSIFSISITGERSAQEMENIRNAIAQNLAASNYNAEVTLEPYHFRDYYSDPLTLEGPDSQQFALEQVRASTSVSELARGLVSQYTDSGIWPSRKGQTTQAVVDRLQANGSRQRLDPRLTLHDAGVRPNDVLSVSPERTAGSINPLLREAALARVRNEVIAFAQSHPGFQVQANSMVVPTEYLFSFFAPGFAPPRTLGESPPTIDSHEVLVFLPQDFPVQAPEVWWQSDIFHPNIHPKNGAVCLGALQDHYRPSMNFGELCQLLIDLASYRNYVSEEGYNPEAQHWASTPAGQAQIQTIGGISKHDKILMATADCKPLKIRKLT